MMAQSWCTLEEPLRRPLTNSNFHDQLQQQPYETVIEDDDLFNVALLFLDTHDDSHSDCSETLSPQAPDDMPTSSTHWLPAKSFQDQLAEVALQSPLEYKLHEQAQSPTIFVDTTGSLAFQANNSQVWSPSQTKPSTPPRRINKRRLEIERLRDETVALQKRLLSLQDHSTKLTSTDAKYGSVNNRPVGEVLGSAWQNIATRQLEQRQRSETENLRLKNVVNEHKRMAKALRRLVARHANAKAWDPLRLNTREPATNAMQARAGSFDAMDDPAVFKELRETLATMYRQTDEILAKAQLASTEESSSSDVSSEIDGDHTLRVQVLGSRTLPFSYSSTSETVWDYTLHHRGPKVMQWEPTESPDTFQTDFVAYTEMYHFKGLGRAKVMMRRIDEPHRVVILRSGLFQCPGADDNIAGPQRLMRHCTWDIIQKTSAAVDTKGDLSGMCQLISCELIMPTLELDGLDEDAQQHQIETLTTMCTQISAFHVKEANEFIDNSLLQRAVKSPRDVEAVASRLTAVPDVYC